MAKRDCWRGIRRSSAGTSACCFVDPELRDACYRAARAWAETFDWDVSAARRWALIAGGKDALAAAVAASTQRQPRFRPIAPAGRHRTTGRDAGSSPGGPHGLVAA